MRRDNQLSDSEEVERERRRPGMPAGAPPRPRLASRSSRPASDEEDEERERERERERSRGGRRSRTSSAHRETDDRERETERAYRASTPPHNNNSRNEHEDSNVDDSDPSPVKPTVRTVTRSRPAVDRRIASAQAASSTFVPRDLRAPPPHPQTLRASSQGSTTLSDKHEPPEQDSYRDRDRDRDREYERRYAAPRSERDRDRERDADEEERFLSRRGSRSTDRERERDRDTHRERPRENLRSSRDTHSRERDRDRERHRDSEREGDELGEDFEELVLEDDRRPARDYRDRERDRERPSRSSWAKANRRDDYLNEERERDRERDRDVRSSGGAWTSAGGRREPVRNEDFSEEEESADTLEDMRRRQYQQQQPNAQRHAQREEAHVRSSFDEYATRREEAGQTLIRKSGRYDDDHHSHHNHASSNGGDPALLERNREKEKQRMGPWMTNDSEKNKNAGSKNNVTNNSSNSSKNNSNSNSGVFSATSRHSFVLVAHPRGARTQMVQCTILRDRTSVHGKLYPTYELVLEEPRKTLIIAQKMSMNRTSNYHLFDMTRGQAGSKLSKKAGNYLGKLRAKSVNRIGYSLLNSKSDKEEIGGVLFDRVTMLDQIKEGNQPRRMTVVIPPLDTSGEGLSRPVPLGSLGVESLVDLLQAIDERKRALPGGFALMHTKDPVFENGNYRLNFHGRVSMPSVKNFQMVSDDDIEDIKCQFGKVDKDVFHLDFKAPFNAVQAFALALCQFNL